VSVSCIILAGGLGTRLRSVLPDQSKSLAPIDGKTFLERQVSSLERRGIDHFILSLGYQSDQVRNSLKAWASLFRIQCVTEPEPLGTGGAIRFAMTAAGLRETLVANGDTFLGGSLAPMLLPLDGIGDEYARMAIVAVSDRRRFGGVVLSPHGRVLDFTEKGQGGPGPINAGLYRISSDAFDVSDTGAFSLEETVLPRLAKAGRLCAKPIEGPFIDIGIPEDYRLFCASHASFA
jgi:D-glycero-alpha-D-manno-heptose 1-phosphate guanylyltransferase